MACPIVSLNVHAGIDERPIKFALNAMGLTLPALAKAVAGLPNSTAERAMPFMSGARKALFGQLRNLDPPVPGGNELNAKRKLWSGRSPARKRK